jgi:signal transduction histidine kinase/CheY-like chemotaxis protein
MNTTGESMRIPAILGGQDLRRRCLIGAVAGLLVVGLALMFASEAGGWGFLSLVMGWLITLLALLVTVVLLRWPRAGVMLLAAGMACLTLLVTWWFSAGAVLALLAVPVGLLVVVAGRPVAALGAALCALAGVLVGYAVGDPIAAGVTVVLLCATTALLNTSLLLAEGIAQWCEDRWTKSRQQLVEAQEQRLELKQAQQDLVQANTELARLTERLNAMRRVAEDSRRAKEEFVANVSHELRTPLNMIIGFAEMISEAPASYGQLPPRLLADIEVILNNSQHLSSLVDDVLDLSQADAGRMALTRRWVSVNAVIATAVSVVRPLFESRGLWLRAEVADGLMTFCDEVRIRQVVVNLLSNAGRFTEAGGATVRAWIEGDDVVVAVQDTGPGISAEQQQAIFEPFRRLEEPNAPQVKGSGLGLAISRRFVEMHGGRMWLESERGVGSTFCFCLPRDGGDIVLDAAPGVRRWFSPYHEYEARRRPSAAPPIELGPRFVVVERGEVMQRLLARYQADAEIMRAPSIEEAAAQCQRVPALAVVVNHSELQDLTTQAKGLVNLPYGIPVLACWVPDRHEAAEELGVVDYLLKPVSRQQLLEAVGRVDLGGNTVLVVDDEPDALQLLSRMLTAAERGYRVLRAESGAEALEMMRRRQPDLVLLDLVMHGMDGYSVLRVKREEPKIAHIPVIAVSAQDPARGPIASNYLAIARSGGLYTQDLLNAIRAVTAALSPPDRLGGPEPDTARRA